MRMKPRLGTVILLVSMVCGTASARTGVIDIADYKGRYDTQDMTPFVYTLLESIPADKPVKLVFPEGTYHFRPEFAAGKYHCITNHDNGYRHFAFPLTGRRNIEIDGGGSEFIFHGRIIPFLIEDSHGVTLRNFTVDWEVPFTLEAKVTTADAETQRVEIEIPDEFGHAVENGKLIMRAEGWEERIPGENIVFDPRTMATAYRSDDYYIPKPDNFDIRVTPTAPGRYELHTRFVRALPPVGTILTFKGVFTQNRHSPAIHATASSGVLVEDVTIHHCGGMGLIAEKADNVTVRRLQVVLRKGSPRMITTTADATHFCNCRGTVLIEECVFENMLDDATNVHGSYVRVTGITAPDQVIARINHPQQAGYEFAGKGDEIDVVDAETLLAKHTLRVKKSERINAHYIRLTFTAPVEGRLTVGDGLENMSWYPELIFRNNVVRNNRARSILVSTPRKVVVEGNTFSSMMSAILFEGGHGPLVRIGSRARRDDPQQQVSRRHIRRRRFPDDLHQPAPEKRGSGPSLRTQHHHRRQSVPDLQRAAAPGEIRRRTDFQRQHHRIIGEVQALQRPPDDRHPQLAAGRHQKQPLQEAGENQHRPEITVSETVSENRRPCKGDACCFSVPADQRESDSPPLPGAKRFRTTSVP